jgi:hypothetical protein
MSPAVSLPLWCVHELLETRDQKRLLRLQRQLRLRRMRSSRRDLVAAVDAAGGAVPLPDGRTVSVGRAEFDALLGERRKRAWVIIRKQAPMPARR